MVALIVILLMMANLLFDRAYAEQYDIWGDLTDTYLIVSSSQTRYAFPFMQRTIDITYPDVSIRMYIWNYDFSYFRFWQDFEGAEQNGIIRGIQHSNRLTNKDCQRPVAILINGGVNEETATMRITSTRGCGIHSFVEFFIEQPQIPMFIP